MEAQTHIMDFRLHKHNSSSSSSSASPFMSALTKKLIWDNNKNVFRITRIGFGGEVPTRYNIETQEEEYWLCLDFVNFEGWCTEAFLWAELRKSEEAHVEVNK